MVREIKRIRLSADVCKLLDIFENSTTEHIRGDIYELYYDGTNYILRYNALDKRLWYENWNIGALLYEVMNFDKIDYLNKIIETALKNSIYSQYEIINKTS